MELNFATLLTLSIVALVLVSGCTQAGTTSPPTTQPPTIQPPQTQPPTGAQTHNVEITASGFSPASLTIKAGDTVKWINNDVNLAWPASAVHPTHTVYPGSDIAKCRTAEQPNIFDACEGLAQGGSWSFTFTQAGTWRYHNHLNLGHTGTIIVQ